VISSVCNRLLGDLTWGICAVLCMSSGISTEPLAAAGGREVNLNEDEL